MPNKYPEDIDQLDDFYKSQLADFEITPPDDLWDKINAGKGTANDAKNTTASFLSGTTKIIGLSIVTGGLIAIGIYYFWFRSATISNPDNTVTPTVEQPLEKQQEHNDNKNRPAASNPTEPNSNRSSGNPTIKEQTDQSHTKNTLQEVPQEETPVLINTPKEEIKTDSVVESKPVEKPKEKVKFKDKYKKDYQDSTSKIFVPGSK